MLLQLEREHVSAVETRYGAEVARATERVLAIRADLARCYAENLAAMGDELGAVKKRLPYGRWLRWLAEDAGISQATASHAMQAARLQREDYPTFNSLARFEPSKVYALLDAPVKSVRGLTPETALPPGSGLPPKPLGVMSAREFAGALRMRVRGGRAATPRIPAVVLPTLDTSSKSAFAKSFLAAIAELIRQAPVIRKLPGKLPPAAKEAVESAVELLRKAVLRWPAWARRHR